MAIYALFFFQNGGRPLSWDFRRSEMWMYFCFRNVDFTLWPKFAWIRAVVTELRSLKWLSKWRLPPYWIFFVVKFDVSGGCRWPVFMTVSVYGTSVFRSERNFVWIYAFVTWVMAVEVNFQNGRCHYLVCIAVSQIWRQRKWRQICVYLCAKFG